MKKWSGRIVYGAISHFIVVVVFFFHEYTRVIRDHSCVTGDIKHFLTICHALIPAQVTPHA